MNQLVYLLNNMSRKYKKLNLAAFFAGLLLSALACTPKVGDTAIQKINSALAPDNSSTVSADVSSDSSSATSTEAGIQEDGEDIDTSNWKTYRNEEYGFEVKYPEGWELILKNNNTIEEDGIFIIKNDSRLAVLPKGEYDQGLPFNQSLKEVGREIIGGKNFIKKIWTLDNQKILAVYTLNDSLNNWLQCNQENLNCSRIDIMADNGDDFEILNKVVEQIVFN